MAIRDWLYKSSPIYGYPELPGELSVPSPTDIDPVTGLPRRIDMSGGRSDVPEQAGKERTNQKTGLGRALMDVLPRVMEAGIAGAATPNIAGGGPTDFFRAMQAGRNQLDARDANRLAMMRQAREDEYREEQRQQQAALYGAHADLYQAQAEAARREKPGLSEKYAELIKLGFSPEQARIVVSNGPLQDKSAADPHKGMTYVPPDHPAALQGLGIKDAQGGAWLANELLGTMMKPNPREPAAPRPFEQAIQNADTQETTIYRRNLNEPDYTVTRMGPGSAPGRPPVRATPERPPGVRDFAKERKDFKEDLSKYADDRDKEVAAARKATAEETAGDKMSALATTPEAVLRREIRTKEAKKAAQELINAAEAKYNRRVLERKQTYDETVGMLGGAAAQAEKAAASQPAGSAAKPKRWNAWGAK